MCFYWSVDENSSDSDSTMELEMYDEEMRGKWRFSFYQDFMSI